MAKVFLWDEKGFCSPLDPRDSTCIFSLNEWNVSYVSVHQEKYFNYFHNVLYSPFISSSIIVLILMVIKLRIQFVCTSGYNKTFLKCTNTVKNPLYRHMLLTSTECSGAAKVRFALSDKKMKTPYQETAAREHCVCILNILDRAVTPAVVHIGPKHYIFNVTHIAGGNSWVGWIYRRC